MKFLFEWLDFIINYYGIMWIGIGGLLGKGFGFVMLLIYGGCYSGWDDVFFFRILNDKSDNYIFVVILENFKKMMYG